MIVSPVRQDKTRLYFIWSLIQSYDPPSLTLTLTLTLTHPLPSPPPTSNQDERPIYEYLVLSSFV